MNIEETQRNGVDVLALHGRLVLSEQGKLRDIVDAALERGVSRFLIDLSGSRRWTHPASVS